MKKYPYVPADLVKSVNSVLDKRHNVIEQDLRDRYQLDESEGIELLDVFTESPKTREAGELAIRMRAARSRFDKSGKKVISKRAQDMGAKAAAAADPYGDRQAQAWARELKEKVPSRRALERFGTGSLVTVGESPVVGVIKGQLPGDQHLCATRIFSEEFGEGTPVYSMHADPDEDGLIEWYDVMFEHGIERVFTEDVQVLAEMSHGDDHDDDKKKKRGKKHKKSHMKKEKDDEDDDMKMESNGYPNTRKALRELPGVKAAGHKATVRTRYNDDANQAIAKDNEERAKERMRVGAEQLPHVKKGRESITGEAVEESKKPKAETIAASKERYEKIDPERQKEIIAGAKNREKLRKSGNAPTGIMAAIRNIFGEAKQEPTFDIEKSLPTNAHTSGFQVAIKAINQSGLPNKADFRHAIAQAVEHPNFNKKMLRALSKPQGAGEVLKIAAEFLKAQKQGEPSKPRQMSFLKTESVDIVKSAIKRLRESQQMLLPLDVGAPNLPLHHGYQFRHGWKVIANDKGAETPFRLERTATNGKTHVVQLPDDVKTVKDLMQHLGTNPKTTTYTSRGGVDAGTPGNLFQTVAFDRS